MQDSRSRIVRKHNYTVYTRASASLVNRPKFSPSKHNRHFTIPLGRLLKFKKFGFVFRPSGDPVTI